MRNNSIFIYCPGVTKGKEKWENFSTWAITISHSLSHSLTLPYLTFFPIPIWKALLKWVPKHSICIFTENYEFCLLIISRKPFFFSLNHRKVFVWHKQAQKLNCLFYVQLKFCFAACYDKLSQNIHKSSYFILKVWARGNEKFMLHLFSLITVTIHVKRFM